MPVARVASLVAAPAGRPSEPVSQDLTGRDRLPLWARLLRRWQFPRVRVTNPPPSEQRLLRPMPGVITQGVRPGHPALDIACNVGTPVRAAHDGQGGARTSHTHGITFELRRADGLVTSYSHLSAARPGGAYKRGDQIGACGNTGSWTTGPHLHFESNRPELLNSLADQ